MIEGGTYHTVGSVPNLLYILVLVLHHELCTYSKEVKLELILANLPAKGLFEKPMRKNLPAQEKVAMPLGTLGVNFF